MFRVLVFVLVLYFVDCYNYNCDGCKNVYTRIKRAKYFPSQPIKFYNLPPNSVPIRGPFSYTPPPGYTPNDVGPQFPSNPRPYKVSKRPTNEGLGDEDLNNLFKYLSKRDLDRIVEYASERTKYSESNRESNYRDIDNYPPNFNNYENYIKNDDNEDSGRILNNKRPSENRYTADYNDPKFSNNQFTGPFSNQPANSQTALDTDESMQQNQFSFLDGYIQNEIGLTPDTAVFTDSRTIQEENLPRPLNLRDDYEISFTNDVPSVAKPENLSYKLENFADLPLMDFENSKLHKVSSYNVPHYSVISNSAQQKPTKSFSSSFPSSSSINTPEVEPAPPASVAREQSEAHLKAIKIWTHKSKGTAYTLHDDGTLSLEKPTRPRPKFN